MAIDFGIRIGWLAATVGADKESELIRRILQVMESETLAVTLNSDALQLEGTGTYQVELTIT